MASRQDRQPPIEAVGDYHAKSDRLSEAERARMLRAIDVVDTPPSYR
jgi:hypothetical protein